MHFNTFIKKHKFFIFVFLLALVMRLAYFGISYESRGNDLMLTISGADCYYAIADNIIHGRMYSCDLEPPYTLNAVRPPVYPYFIALVHQVFGSYWAVLFMQILVGAILPLLAMKVVSYIFEDKRVARITGILLAIEPFSMLFSVFFYSETLFILLFLSALLFIFRYFSEQRVGDLMLSAVFLGASVLTKPTAQYMFLFFVAAILLTARKKLTKQTLVHVGVFLAVVALAVTPWLLRNYTAFGSFAISPQKEVNIYSIMVPSVLAVVHNTNFLIEYKALLETGALDPNSATFDGTKDYVQKAIPVFLAHPTAFAIVCANTALNFFIHDGMYDVLKHVGYRPDKLFGKPALFVLVTDPAKFFSFVGHFLMTPIILILVGRVAWIAVTALFVLGAIRYIRKNPKVYGLLSLAIVTYFLLTTLVVGLGINARYRMPVNSIIIAFAVSELLVVSRFVKSKISSRV